jgi:tetratricopeptide (TPR) repeat protein
MESIVYREVSAAVKIIRGLEESRENLKWNNLFSCIVGFREVLGIFIKKINIMSEAHKNKVTPLLNDFQKILSNSIQFNDIYGSVAFRDNDFKTSYEFLGQLIQIKEDEIASVLINKEVSEILNLANLNKEEQEKTLQMVSLVERGEQSVLRKLVAENDGLASLVINYYNDTGINSRAAGDINKAIQEYKKALYVSPEDEHLFYNLARSYIEIGDKKNAEENIRQAISLNPEFKQGLKLQNYIDKWGT